MANPETTTQQMPRNEFGLTHRDMQTLRQILSRYTDIQTVHIFGSRAKGNFRPGSDIDLAIMNSNLGTTTLRKANSDFEESTLPYRVDLVDYHTITHPSLKEHIDRVGILFYQR